MTYDIWLDGELRDIRLVFGSRLKRLLQERQIRSADVTTSLGCNPVTIRAYIDGITLPRLMTVIRLSQLLGVSVDYMLGLSNEQ